MAMSAERPSATLALISQTIHITEPKSLQEFSLKTDLTLDSWFPCDSVYTDRYNLKINEEERE